MRAHAGTAQITFPSLSRLNAHITFQLGAIRELFQFVFVNCFGATGTSCQFQYALQLLCMRKRKRSWLVYDGGK